MASNVPQRSLPSGFKSSAQGFGCMGLTGFFHDSSIPEEQGIEVLRKALELGVTTFNTAYFYGPYTNQKLIGKAFAGVPREKFVITSKWGPMTTSDHKFLPLDFSPKACRAAVEASLQDLQVDYIDVLILRGMGPLANVEEVMAGMKAMVEEGKVKYLGLSEVAPKDVRRAHAIHPIALVEMEWSLFTRGCEEDLVPLCRELGIGFLAYSPLGRGMLTGKLTPESLADNDFRRTLPWFQGENAEKARGEDVIPIPGTKSVKYLEENVGALALKLSAAELADLEAAVPHSQVKGDRYQNLAAQSYEHGA